MRTFDSRHYKVLGFRKVAVSGWTDECWLLQTINSRSIEHYVPQTILVKSGKFVDHGYVYYLHEDGRVENKLRCECALPTQEGVTEIG